MNPSRLLTIALITEIGVNFSKRLIYILDPSLSILYLPSLLIGDAIFSLLFFIMLSSIKFDFRHWLLLIIFSLLFVYSIFVNGSLESLLAVRNTYAWFFATTFMLLSNNEPVTLKSIQPVVKITTIFSLLLLVFSIWQIQSDYAFEKPWFELSGTSLKYDGVTNFGQAAKAFSLMSGPTDFASFGLFTLAIGLFCRAFLLFVLGLLTLVLSGTRGILYAIPIWLGLVYLSRFNIRRNFIIFVTFFALIIFVYSDELVAHLYSLENSRFSMATLAPRIEIWLALNPYHLLFGGGLAANISQDDLFLAPNVIDSGFVYFLSELGLPLTLFSLLIFLTAIQRDLMLSRRGVLQFYLGILLVASLAQLPFYTRLSNFLVCFLIYASIYYQNSSHIMQSYSKFDK